MSQASDSQALAITQGQDLSTQTAWYASQASLMNRPDMEWEFIIRQHPARARMCGFSDIKDRRLLDPPPVVQLILKRNGQRIMVSPEDCATLICHASIWSPNGKEDRNLIVNPRQPNPSTSQSNFSSAKSNKSAKKQKSATTTSTNTTTASTSIAPTIINPNPPTPPASTTAPGFPFSPVPTNTQYRGIGYPPPPSPLVQMPPSTSFAVKLEPQNDTVEMNNPDRMTPEAVGLRGIGTSSRSMESSPSSSREDLKFKTRLQKRKSSEDDRGDGNGNRNGSVGDKDVEEMNNCTSPSSSFEDVSQSQSQRHQNVNTALSSSLLSLNQIAQQQPITPTSSIPPLISIINLDNVDPARVCHTLVGSVVSPCMILKDVDGTEGMFFVFHDLSVRPQGTFRLKLQVVNAASWSPASSAKGVLWTNVFEVFPPKTFPGMAESTNLSRVFSRQGLPIHVRKDYSTADNQSIVQVPLAPEVADKV
ncbi:hypothetical protein HDU76_005407 [Blyttiomyces sp. JEL0837]|nr:hypothetical protein HDU76_005407 [Blyttiomyces sp. JEL0837]